METETINRGLVLFISETAEYWMETDFIVAAEIFRGIIVAVLMRK